MQHWYDFLTYCVKGTSQLPLLITYNDQLIPLCSKILFNPIALLKVSIFELGMTSLLELGLLVTFYERNICPIKKVFLR